MKLKPKISLKMNVQKDEIMDLDLRSNLFQADFDKSKIIRSEKDKIKVVLKNKNKDKFSLF